MYEWVQPKTLIPVHGEVRHLTRHAQFARELGITSTIVPANGDIISISKTGVKKVDEAPYGRLALDGKLVTAADNTVIADRRRMSVNGHITVSLLIDDSGRLMVEPILSIRGVPGSDSDTLYDAFLDIVETAFDRLPIKARSSDDKVEEACRISIRRHTRQVLGKNPTVDTLITRREDLTI